MDDLPRCTVCNTPWAYHLGCEGLCATNQRLKAELEEAREALSREGIMRDRQGNLRRHPWLKEKE